MVWFRLAISLMWMLLAIVGGFRADFVCCFDLVAPDLLRLVFVCVSIVIWYCLLIWFWWFILIWILDICFVGFIF